MSRQEDMRRWHDAGLAHKFFEIDGKTWLEATEPMRAAVKADPSLVVRTDEQAIGENGRQTVWTYLAGRRDADGKVAALAEGEDDCAYNISWPCPPCEPPPNGDD
jgi:hypothetical protein